tara:strand:+ start:2420 stop:3160 length:741 start_codon:yes stop_codon:yes gene_type:complete
MPGGYGTSGPWGSSGDSYTSTGQTSGAAGGPPPGSGNNQNQNNQNNYNAHKQLADSLKAAGAVTSGALSGTALWQQEGLPENVYHSTFQQGQQAYSPTGYVHIDPNLNPGSPKALGRDEEGNIVWSPAADTWDPYNQRWVRSTYMPWNPHATTHYGDGPGGPGNQYGYGYGYGGGSGGEIRSMSGKHPRDFYPGLKYQDFSGKEVQKMLAMDQKIEAANVLSGLSQGAQAFAMDPKARGIMSVLTA